MNCRSDATPPGRSPPDGDYRARDGTRNLTALTYPGRNIFLTLVAAIRSVTQWECYSSPGIWNARVDRATPTACHSHIDNLSIGRREGDPYRSQERPGLRAPSRRTGRPWPAERPLTCTGSPAVARVGAAAQCSCCCGGQGPFTRLARTWPAGRSPGRPEPRPASGDELLLHGPPGTPKTSSVRRFSRRPDHQICVSGVMYPGSGIHPSNTGRGSACWLVSGALSMTPAFDAHPGPGHFSGPGIPAWLTLLVIFKFSPPAIRRLRGSLCCGSVGVPEPAGEEGAAAWQSHSRHQR